MSFVIFELSVIFFFKYFFPLFVSSPSGILIMYMTAYLMASLYFLILFSFYSAKCYLNYPFLKFQIFFSSSCLNSICVCVFIKFQLLYFSSRIPIQLPFVISVFYCYHSTFHLLMLLIAFS